MHRQCRLWVVGVVLGLAGVVSSGPVADAQDAAAKVDAVRIPTAGRGNARVEHLGRSVDEIIYEFMQAERIPGLTLAIVQAPYIPRVVSYGVSDLELGRLASTKTVWGIATMSQAFAGVAAVQLVEQGKLDLAATLGRYLTGMPEAWSAVKVSDLIHHTSGIPDYRDADKFAAGSKFDASGLIELAASQPVRFAAGSAAHASATNGLLLSMVIDRVSGMTYEEFVTLNQIRKMGLKHTFFASQLDQIRQEDVAAQGNRHREFKHQLAFVDPTELAAGYDAGLKRSSIPTSPILRGFGDIYASAEDVSVWDIGLAGSHFIKLDNHPLLYSPVTLSGGEQVPACTGWTFYKHRGLMDSKGSVPGYSAYLSRFTDPSELVCVTLLANKEGIDLTNLARKIAAAFDPRLGSGVDDWRLFVMESPHDVNKTVGRIERRLAEMKVPLFAKIDHAANATAAGLKMDPSQVLIFGSPQVGTGLMQKAPAIAGELPLKISVWQDDRGRVWVGCTRIDEVAKGYGVGDDPAIPRMRSLYQGLVGHAVAPH